MQLQGKIEVLMDSKNRKTEKVDGAIIKLDTFDKWIKTASFKSVLQKAGFNNEDSVIVDAIEHTAKGGNTYYTFDITDIKHANGNSAPTQGAAPSSQSPSYTKKTGGYDNKGARLGMAFNNAVQVAISTQKVADEKFISDYTKRYYKLVSVIESELENDVAADSLEDSLDGVFGNPA